MRPSVRRLVLSALALAALAPAAPAAAHGPDEAGGMAALVTHRDTRSELAAVPAGPVLTDAEVAELRAIGDNTGSMDLKGAAPGFEGDPLPDRWPISSDLAALAGRWGIDPARDLARAA